MTYDPTRGGSEGPGAGGADALDDLTVKAAGILAEAVREASIPGVMEFRDVASALDRAVKDRSLSALQRAESTFDRMEGEVRADINALARSKAKDSRDTPAEPAPAAPPPAAKPAAKPAPPAEPLFAVSGGRIRRGG